MATRNDITGDFIRSKKSNDKYRDGWDVIFAKKDTDNQQEEKDTEMKDENYSL
jgi:hypothetical protein